MIDYMNDNIRKATSKGGCNLLILKVGATGLEPVTPAV